MLNMFIEFADLISETSNWHKVDVRYGGGIKSSVFWNGEDSYSVLTYDTEYDNPDMGIIDYRYSSAERSHIEHMPVDDGWRMRWNASRGVPSRGMSFEVIRGRKFPVGMTGTVASLYTYRDRYVPPRPRLHRRLRRQPHRRRELRVPRVGISPRPSRIRRLAPRAS